MTQRRSHTKVRLRPIRTSPCAETVAEAEAKRDEAMGRRGEARQALNRLHQRGVTARREPTLRRSMRRRRAVPLRPERILRSAA